MWHTIITAQITAVGYRQAHIIYLSTKTIVYHFFYFDYAMRLSTFDNKYIAFMVLQLLLFGITKDIIGKSPFRFELKGDNRVGNLMDELYKQYPSLQDLNSLAVAVNGTYAQGDLLINENDEIALIPPVSGG
jgi:molybdopterin converting factor subunit 1